MNRTFIEVPLFTKRWIEIGLTDDDLIQLQIMLLKDPESGPVIEGTGGACKIASGRRTRKEEVITMSTLFDDLQEGLLQAIDYANGTGSARTVTYKIDPVVKFNNDQIREIRINAQMTQHVFADYLGVSVKTVEAWERGRTHPTGPAYRLMSFLADNQVQTLPFVSVEYF